MKKIFTVLIIDVLLLLCYYLTPPRKRRKALSFVRREWKLIIIVLFSPFMIYGMILIQITSLEELAPAVEAPEAPQTRLKNSLLEEVEEVAEPENLPQSKGVRSLGAD